MQPPSPQGAAKGNKTTGVRGEAASVHRSGTVASGSIKGPGVDGQAPYLVLQGRAQKIAYLEALVGNTKPGARLPMVIAIHGLGYRPRFPERPFLTLGKSLRVILPSGPELHHNGGFRWTAIRASAKDPRKLAKVLRRRAHTLAAFADELVKTHPTAGKPIVVGFSQGGMLTWTLALHHADRFAAAFPLAAWVPDRVIPKVFQASTLGLTIRSMHAKDDHILPVARTRTMIEALKKQGLSVDFREFDKAGHDMSDAMQETFSTWLVEALDAQAAHSHEKPTKTEAP